MSGSVGLAPIPTYLSIEKDEQAVATRTEAGDPTTSQAVAHFQAAASAITTPQKLLADYRSLTVVLGAFGMSSMIGQTAVLRDLMTQDPNASTSLAATSGNALWTRFAKLMSDWTPGASPFVSPTAVSTIANQYTEAAFETAQGNSTPGMGNALYFTRTASSVTNIASLMSDPTLLDVTEVTLGLDPTQFGALDFDQQTAILTKQVDLKDFSSASGVQRMAEQYLALTSLNPPAQPATYDVTSLFDGGGDGSDEGDDLFSIIGNSLTTSA